MNGVCRGVSIGAPETIVPDDPLAWIAPSPASSA
jgi:hypothetical protein